MVIYHSALVNVYNNMSPRRVRVSGCIIWNREREKKEREKKERKEGERDSSACMCVHY